MFEAMSRIFLLLMVVQFICMLASAFYLYRFFQISKGKTVRRFDFNIKASIFTGMLSFFLALLKLQFLLERFHFSWPFTYMVK